MVDEVPVLDLGIPHAQDGASLEDPELGQDRRRLVSGQAATDKRPGDQIAGIAPERHREEVERPAVPQCPEQGPILGVRAGIPDLMLAFPCVHPTGVKAVTELQPHFGETVDQMDETIDTLAAFEAEGEDREDEPVEDQGDDGPSMVSITWT